MLTRVLLPILSLAFIAFAALQMTKAQQKDPPVVLAVEPAKSPYATQLAGAGIVEPEGENITVGTNVPGIVADVYVKVGSTISADEPLFRLDDRALRAELELKKATLGNTVASKAKLDLMPRPEELPPLDAKIKEAQANFHEQEKLLDRYRRLAQSNAISEDEILRRQSAYESAKALLAKAEADRNLQGAKAWAPDLAIAEANIFQAKMQLQQTQTEIDRLTMKAPRKSSAEKLDPAKTFYKVLQVNVRPGEYVGLTSGIATIVLGQVGQLHVRLDIDENDIARFDTKFPGVAKPRGNPKQEYKLKFVRVEPYVIPKRSLTGGNTERVDTRVLQVIYQIDTADKPLYVGQQMDVFLDTTGK
jgi:HlyD family secretion protein